MLNKLLNDLLLLIVNKLNNKNLKNCRLICKELNTNINIFKIKINIFNNKFNYIFKTKINNCNNMNYMYEYIKHDRSLNNIITYPLFYKKDIFILFYNILFIL